MTDLIESSLLKEPSVSKNASSASSSEAINVIHFQKDSSPQIEAMMQTLRQKRTR